MNFKHMPELDTPYGYFVVLGVIAVSAFSYSCASRRPSGCE
jgi:Mg2+ and Co2+ transporter CorA